MNFTALFAKVKIAIVLFSFIIASTLNFSTPKPARANPGVLYAAPTAQGSGNCLSWANACTLQTALSLAVAGDEIWVKAGVHYPGNNADDTFTLKDDVAIYGGFAGNESLRNQRNWQNNKTILSGDIDKNDNHGGDFINEDTTQIIGTNSYNVVTGNWVDNTAILDGFIITAGRANWSSTKEWGGGIYNTNSSSPTLRNITISGNYAISGGGMANLNYSSPVLINITFTGNLARSFGGGMYNYESRPVLNNVKFSRNDVYNTDYSGAHGGGMYNYNSTITLTGVIFDHNSSRYEGYYSYDVPTSAGGGMYNNNCSLVMNNVTFDSNSAYSSSGYSAGGGIFNISSNAVVTNASYTGNSAHNGGAIYNSSSSPTFTNITFSYNSAQSNGGGIYNSTSSFPTLTNVIFSYNSASSGGGIYNYSYASPKLVNAVFYKNSASYAGGGIHNYQYSSPNIINTTFSYNIAPTGGGIYNSDSSHPRLTNAILWRNKAYVGVSLFNTNQSIPEISYSNIEGCGASGETWNSACGIDGGGNIEADPLFIDAFNGNLRLRWKSPAVDAGNNAAVPQEIVKDLDGNNRFLDVPVVSDTGSGTPPIVDMGAYEADTSGNVEPFFTSAPETTAYLDFLYVSNVTASDADLSRGDLLTTSAPTLPAWLTLEDRGDGSATLYGTPTSTGEYPIVLKVTDALGLSATQAITVSVIDANRPPAFTSTPITTATQGELYTYDVVATDPDLVRNDHLSFSAPTLPPWLSLDDHGDGTATLSGTPNNEAVGDASVVLQVTDSRGQSDSQVFTITVSNLNDPPTFTSHPVTSARQGLLYTYNTRAEDPDLNFGDKLTIGAITLPSWLTLTDQGDGTATLSGTPANEHVGDHPVLLTVTDLEGQSASQAFTISVANLNDPPSFTSTPPTIATRGRLYIYEVSATDPDLLYGDSLTFSAQNLPSWLSLIDYGDGTATLSGTPLISGQYNIILRVTDSKGLTASQSLTLRVVESNEPPFFISRPITTTWQGSFYNYEIQASDPDLVTGESLTITAPTLPNWLRLEDHRDGTASLVGVPTNAEVGDHGVILQVSDSSGLSASQAFTITVYNLNDPPIFTSQPITITFQDSLYTYEITATDPDLIYGDSLFIEATSLPSWLTLVNRGDGTATLSGTPANSGSYLVILRVRDSYWTFTEQRFVIIVEEKPRFKLYLPFVIRSEEQQE